MHLSVVIPTHNEAQNVAQLLDEIEAALVEFDYEIIIVNDGSSDDSAAVLAQLANKITTLRVIEHQASMGQSYAVITGVQHARAEVIATLDGDGQNNPADIPALYQCHQNESIDLVIGHRIQRQDTAIKKISSTVSNALRCFVLKDGIPDSGCGIKVFTKRVFLSLPHFDHMHRYLPALFQREGALVKSYPVSHRLRERGQSKYGIHNRLWVGIIDLLMVRWLLRRKKHPVIKHITEHK